MARQNAEFAIDQGPSKLDLMLSLFDTDVGTRTVKFRVVQQLVQYNTFDGWYYVQIISARRRHPSAKIWDIEGIVHSYRGEERVSIHYLSDTREGRMRFEEELRTHGVMETPSDVGTRKANALFTIIEKMIVRYRKSHSGNLDDEMFQLLEKAKRVGWAKDDDSLTEAIKDI